MRLLFCKICNKNGLGRKSVVYLYQRFSISSRVSSVNGVR